MAEYSAAGELDHINSNPNATSVVNSGRQFRTGVDQAVRPTSVIVHRTTSESLRLTHESPHIPQSVPDLKKPSSFQITSVTVSSSVSNDGEDDSCGEVEDSQIELPEPGEEMNQSEFQSEGNCGETVNISMPVPVSNQQQQASNDVVKLEDKEHGVALGPRFKVVRIDNEPFKRGRWQCLDYLDPKEELLPCSGASSSGSLSEHAMTDEAAHSHQTASLQYPSQPIISLQV